MRDLQSRVEAVRWYHDFDFGNGLRAQSSHENPDGVRAVWAFIAEQLGRVPFDGATVLDVGAWDGYWSFFAERRGASRVLATDDRTQRWSQDSGIGLARELLGSRIEIREDVPVYELAGLGQTFDVVLCLGVYYHLWDPLFAFTQIRHCCHRDTVVIVEGELAWTGLTPNEARYFQSSWQECVLSASLLERFLRLAYLRVDEQVWMHEVPPGRPTGPVQVDRSLLVCRPFEGPNPAYVYRPHFGLAAYDDRFRDGSTPSPRHRAVISPVEIPGVVEPGVEFEVVLRVENVGDGPWRALRARPCQPMVAGPSVRRRDLMLDLRRLFLEKEVSSNGPVDSDAVQRYRRFLEDGCETGSVTIGAQLWDAGQQVQIDQDYGRGFLSSDVAPGQSATVGLRLRAPSTPGRFVVRFDMVCELVAWFSSDGSDPLDAAIAVHSGRP